LLDSGTIVAGGYRIDGVLGEGGMGTVYRATQLSLNRVVALKLLSTGLSDDPNFRARFQREGQLQAALDHLHIVTVYEAGQSEQGLFLAMRLISGPTLKELITSGQLDPRRSLRLLMQVALALDAAHAAGLIHRDVKPHNILIGERDHAYLADFGLTNTPDDTGTLTGTGQFVGTIDYISPEQIRGQSATGASDVYALAGVMCECLTGQVPFPRATEEATINAHLVDPPPRVTERRPDLPVELDDVIAAGLAKDPAKRPATARALVLAATATLTGAHGQGELDAPSSEPIVPGADRGATRTRAARVPAAGAAATALSADPAVAAAAAAATRPSELPDGAAAATVLAGAGAAGAGVASGGERAPTTGAGGAGASAGAATAVRSAGPPRAAVFGILALLAVAVVVVGYLVGHSGGAAASPSNSASSGDIELSFGSGWQRTGDQPAIPGLSFAQPMVLAKAQPGAGSLTVGSVDGSGPTLLPAAFRAEIQGTAPQPNDPVSIGSLQGYRYSALTVKGLSGAVTVYVVPTTGGVMTLVCHPAGATGAFLTQCADVVGTLKLSGVTPYALGPNPAYAKTLASQLSTLDSEIKSPAASLASAATAADQAAAADSLAAAYQKASSDLGRVTVDPATRDANAALVAALAKIANGYSQAATAARAYDAAAYKRAETAITRGSTAMTTALDSLKSLGYSVQ
jgi:hypothetical protein